MPLRARTPFTAIRSEGALLPPDLLQRIADGDPTLGGLAPADYHLVAGERLTEAINRSWSRLLGLWASFRHAATALPPGDPATGLTRERWLLPLFAELGYGRLPPAKAVEVNGKSYPISHLWGQTPIHLVGCGVDLDRRQPGVAGAAKASPHSLLQEALNRSDAWQWGFVANGLRLRILRDTVRLTRQSYLEFDLEAMFDGQLYADFALLWLVCHQSRVEAGADGSCWLERWAQAAQTQGARALDRLRAGVETAIAALGRGFLAHPANGALRERLRSGQLSAQDYYRQLLRLVYRLLFLLVAEDRDVLLDPRAEPAARERYTRYYALAGIRRLAERRAGTQHADLYRRVRLVMQWLGGDGAPALALPALGGWLFSPAAVPDLDAAELSNRDLLAAVRALAFTDDRHGRRIVDYQHLGAEELGSVYESLLELRPALNVDAASFALETLGGHERKTTGSYYTPSSLIAVALDTALEPALAAAARQPNPESAILALKVVDPACGSGHFLLAAAHRMARRLAAIRTGEAEPAPEATRTALRDVIGRCLYGVDLNPMAVELCKVSLWLEALEPGKPLTFLDHHIQCGNSLIGATPAALAAGIPDGAFDPVSGDDKAVCREYRKRNQRERSGQLSLFDAAQAPWERLGNLATAMLEVAALPDATIADARRKQAQYEALVRSSGYEHGRLLADLWCAALVWPKVTTEALPYPITEEVFRRAERNPYDLPHWLRAAVERLAAQYRFFHWHLAFPDVFRPCAPNDPAGGPHGWTGGFAVVLGNPPWERIKLQEQEHFADVPEIARAANKAARDRLIAAWRQGNEYQRARIAAYDAAKYRAEAESRFIRVSGRFPLTAVGDVNTYALFAELSRSLLAPHGRAGIIVPTGIATDDSTKAFFADLVQQGQLVSLYDFENREKLFPAVDSRYKFSVLAIGQTDQPARFAFFLTQPAQLADPQRVFTLSAEELALINPNTRTAPVFRTRADAELTTAIYRRVPVLVNERTGANPWGVTFLRMFDMSNDSHLFHPAPGEGLLPLYEAKLLHQYTHRWATYHSGPKPETRELTAAELADPALTVTPRYWVPAAEVEQRLAGRWERQWLVGFRGITNATNERTAIFSLLPFAGVGNSVPIMLLSEQRAVFICGLIACLSSLVFDFVTRQKVGGTNFNFFIVQQLPVLPPDAFSAEDLAFIVPRVLELVYTAWDMRPFADDVWAELATVPWGDAVQRDLWQRWQASSSGPVPSDPSQLPPPFRWNEERRAVIRAELDARIARLYGLSRDELRYILDPADVHGPAFPGETFRVLKDNELRRYGEYHTRRLVLEAWDRETYA